MSLATTTAFIRSTALLNTHLQAGHADPSRPKYPKFLKDLRTHLTLTRRFLYAIEPPASEREKLSYLVATVSHIAAVLDDEPALKAALASIQASDTLVLSIDPEGAPV